jgi:Ca2+-binding RTX toxin-like protein
MAKFVAKQPYTSQSLLGIGLFSSPKNVRFDDVKGSGFTAQTTTVELDVGGHGFKSTFLGAGQPKAVGTVTDIKYYSSGTLIYKLSDAKYPFHDLADSNDLQAHTEKIFAKDDIIKGSYGNDILYGYKGKDTLTGGGGVDTLDGGKGKDTYVFNADPVLSLDTITKYEKGEHFELKAKYFPGLVAGELLPEQFVVGGAAQDADDRIIFNSSNGLLYHDADGNGALAPVAFARLANYLTGIDHLGAEDFLII